MKVAGDSRPTPLRATGPGCALAVTTTGDLAQRSDRSGAGRTRRPRRRGRAGRGRPGRPPRMSVLADARRGTVARRRGRDAPVLGGVGRDGLGLGEVVGILVGQRASGGSGRGRCRRSRRRCAAGRSTAACRTSCRSRRACGWWAMIASVDCSGSTREAAGERHPDLLEVEQLAQTFSCSDWSGQAG